MSDAPQYCEVHQLADRLGIDHDDPRSTALSHAVGAASRWVEEQTDRRFYTLDETRYFSPIRGAQSVAIDDCLSVSAVTTDQDGDGAYETVWTVGTDYWLGPRNAPARGQPFYTLNRNVVVGRYFFPCFEDSVAVTGAFGTTAQTPEGIRELALYVAELLARDVMEMSIPGASKYQVGDDLQVTMAPTDLPMVHQDILYHWRQVSVA